MIINNKFIVNVEAAIYHKDKWLIIKRSELEEHAPGTYSLIGGKVEVIDKYENILEENLKREILEEVGIEVYNDIKYVQSRYFKIKDGTQVIDVIFLCKYKKGEPQPIDKGEVSSVHWMKLCDILENNKSPFYLKESLIEANKVKEGLRT
ncbi:NUDIX hydrolase [Thermohalobacter berrensis]|uniref:DNA mismatch repair protein MutT n=1 Tax=Thermohalobacter berrensis TaxID=99594 RepID=A0A419SXV3_9FIRM|nr:NUDIX domain-containing protein [Thermohalobacter berrensis]RKD30011.1 DNA mismatch repair protein MutT [Thermohalobacter berrensis]